MTITSFSFLYLTPDGREPVFSKLMQQPLLLDAGERHPSLTMADYFAALQRLVSDSEELIAPAILSAHPATKWHCTISSEKLGAFYHVAKVEFLAGEKRAAFAIDTAISELGKKLLEKDHVLLRKRLPFAMRRFVPKVFFYTKSEQSDEGLDPFSHMAVEWLEDFHEWHLCGSERSAPEFTLWTDNGIHRLTENESRSLLRQIAQIITLSYDWPSRTFLQQWHHAAGDFIARCSNGTLDVRLITVRAIEPFPFLDGHDLQVKFSSLLLFLVDLTIRMRLDKLDGVGKTVWLDDFVVEEAIRGFFSGLAEIGGSMGEAHGTFMQLLPHFSADDLKQLSSPLFAAYRELLSPADLAEVGKNFAGHIEYLTACLAEQEPG